MLTIAPRSDASRGNDEARSWRETEIHFESGGETLSGTVLVPDSPGPKPAIVLVHGAGPGRREQYRQEAEAFAREGLVTLIYDKRRRGYSQFERSYESLAEDALAAVKVLRVRPEVESRAVGLWGLSEGAWVVPMAASRSEDVAFVVLVAATGVSPSRQHSWYLQNQLHRQGVSGSMVEAVSRTATRVLIEAGLFAEAHHDPIVPFEGLHQPVLALWGEKDRIEPPAESIGILRNALERSGNDAYTLRVFAGAEHGLRRSRDGYTADEDLADGYARTVGSWVREVSSGRAPGPAVLGPDPEQPRPSRSIPPLAWWESGWVQLGAVVLPIFLFASHLGVSSVAELARRWRERGAPSSRTVRPVRRWMLMLAGSGLVTVASFIGYLGFLMSTGATSVGPVAAGRALPWLVLQALSVVAVVSCLGLVLSLWAPPRAVRQARRGAAARAWSTTLLMGGVVFVAWAGYWGLLLP